MKKIFTQICLIVFLSIEFIGCTGSSTQSSETSTLTQSKQEDLFDDTNALTKILSKNGIGELKEWSNPMDMGWGSLTDYYQFGLHKNDVGMQNNIAYYLEGNKTSAKRLTINLNINNPADKKNALKFLEEVTERTFKSLDLDFPKGLRNAILKPKKFKANLKDFTTLVELDKSKIETWKVNIERR